jgi:oligosaccharyltransferase complex subunit alpha (ribophorin I)
MLLPSLLSLLVSAAAVLALANFENTAIVRTIELGGSLTHVTTTYAAKALVGNVQSYTIAIPRLEKERSSFLEVKIKGQQTPLAAEFDPENFKSSQFDILRVQLPKPLDVGSTVNLVLETVQTHASRPWPERAGQNDGQALKYDCNLLVISPYNTLVQRTKIKSPHPEVISYTTPKDVTEFTLEDSVVAAGSTITYGPYRNIGPSAVDNWAPQQVIEVHYPYEYPVVEIASYERHAEVSHWGANLNIDDKIHLRNAGPELRGHFSRIEHQRQAYSGKRTPHVIPGMVLHLPAGISNVYYYDTIGNVSTSQLRVAPSPTSRSARNTKYSQLEMKPRYPILGGWNYTFTLGWDSPLADYAGWDTESGKYVLEVPLMTFIPASVYTNASISIVLPEGATDVEYFPSYPAVSQLLSTHTTYLDTTGRPKITLEYSRLTDRHAFGTVYVTYRVPFSAHMKKPIAVATAFLILFALGLVGRRVNLELHNGPKQKQL